ncbi:CocE/NonD family hydrolase [Pseudoflavitalea sp. X16]|uniref:CocE/NonD family hydrolase n=1 Tax=Paraflavitalea devenefica TaxID=2716334 RepID=UPI0014212239|nr:CocE/NonD family hydrolase [Paraflavitalea devenefica]NII27141.1 CocE/NonD family hydrolase [Paraflavitalea devenefica]
MLRLTALLLLLTCAVHAQTATDSKYERQEVMIPMRDGIKLNTVIFTPKAAAEKYPFLLRRTPYGVSGAGAPDKSGYTKDMADDGYIFVFQDIRGRYKSEGKFEMQRFSRIKKDLKAIDESTDTYDTFEWLLKNIPNNNGKGGMYGISYDGWTTMQGAIDPHPALVAVSEQATPSDMWLGDDFHHNGAFRLSYGFEYAFMEEAGKTDSLFPFGMHDLYDWYLQLGPLSNVNKKHFHNHIPTWNDFASHPNYDAFWQKQSLAYRLDSPRVYTMHVAGWWDQEDFYGPLKAYEILEKKDRSHKNYIVAGPWNHGGWAGGAGSHLGNISFDTATGPVFRKDIQARWFAYHLKGKGDGNFAEAITFQTGSNVWQHYNNWPPAEALQQNLYFHPNGKLSFEKPSAANGTDSYISDPARPVPYRTRPIEQTYGPGSRWFTWLTEDQRFVHNRPDVLSWETDVLTEDITVTGQLWAKLFAATTGSDADWVVKLIDVYPAAYPKDRKMGGYQFMIANDVFRGRFRKSFEHPEPITPNKVESYTIDLHSINHVFKKGHKIMVQVQSTWFPIIDRNPQKYIPNIFEAKESDFQKATHTIHRSTRFPSHIELSIIK